VGAVNLVVPRQTVDELARNKERIVRDTGKSLSSTFKRVKEAVRQFGQDKGKLNALASLDDVDHRITILARLSMRAFERSRPFSVAPRS
jgi:hypothetical protein